MVAVAEAAEVAAAAAAAAADAAAADAGHLAWGVGPHADLCPEYDNKLLLRYFS